MPGNGSELLVLDLSRAQDLQAELPADWALDGGARRAKGLADPTRLAVTEALRRGGELCVTDLAWVIQRSDKLVSHHLRELRTAGLVSSRQHGKLVLYGLNPTGRELVDVVLPTTGTSGSRDP